MKNQMALADPGDWCTLAYAAEQMGVSQRTVRRDIAAGVLTARTPRVGSRETGRRHLLLYTLEVLEQARARKMVKRA